MPQIEAGMRARIAEFLPAALDKAIASYEAHLDKTHAKPSEFKTHHEAGKAALAHIELMTKLAKWADLDPKLKDENHQKTLEMLIDQGKRELDGA